MEAVRCAFWGYLYTSSKLQPFLCVCQAICYPNTLKIWWYYQILSTFELSFQTFWRDVSLMFAHNFQIITDFFMTVSLFVLTILTKNFPPFWNLQFLWVGFLFVYLFGFNHLGWMCWFKNFFCFWGQLWDLWIYKSFSFLINVHLATGQWHSYKLVITLNWCTEDITMLASFH